MAPQLILTPHQWAQHGLTYARGQAFDPSGTLLRAESLAARFDALLDRDAWLAVSTVLNGCFAVVKTDATELRASVDRLRTIPLFFAHVNGRSIISDTADAINALLPRSNLDEISASEFRLTGYVTGARTLIEGIYQIPSGQCLLCTADEDPSLGLRRYYEFRHGKFASIGDERLIGTLVETHERVFRRLLRDVGNRPVAVPLSGGYDSRLIGVMLRDLGCKNVLCYSYGAANNWESKISRELAAYLGLRWTMVPYSGESWRRWAATPEFRRYFRWAGHLTAVPHVQDWPAVYELHRRGELPKDTVFVPGHSGDFLAGSHVPKWYPARPQLTREEILQSLFDAHYSLWDWSPDDADGLREKFVQRIEQVTGPIGVSTPEKAADVYERWDCQERQAKFIVNSMRVYESFGYEWRLPLFDSELMDFWSHVPIADRVERRLYFRFVDKHQRLPVTKANADHSTAVASAIGWINRSSLRPLAKRVQRALRRAQWRRQYETDDMRWFAMVDPDEFRARYTGREIGHSFFALRYLNEIAS